MAEDGTTRGRPFNRGHAVTEVVIAFQGGRAWRQHQPAAKRPSTRRYPARIARQLALAHALRRRLEREFADFSDVARQLDFTRAHVTQLMDLLLLAPEVREGVKREISTAT